jgi:hypothetical protein
MVQDATVRANTYNSKAARSIHKQTTLGEFIRAGTNDPNHSGNCLDSLGLRAETPGVIAYVSPL